MAAQDDVAGLSARPGTTRRRVLGGALAAGLVTAAATACTGDGSENGSEDGDGTGRPTGATGTGGPDLVPAPEERSWLGPGLWGNRLQDWVHRDGRAECVSAGVARTVALVDRTLAAGAAPATLTVRTGTLEDGDGFSGFLLGVGAGALHPLAAALAQGVSGTGGGFFAGYSADGRVVFRDHSDEARPKAFRPLEAGARRSIRRARSTDEDITLTLEIAPETGSTVPGATAAGGPPGTSSVTLTATDDEGTVLARSSLAGVADTEVTGGVLLVSTGGESETSRHWFADVTGSGAKLRPTGLDTGPVVGTMFSQTAGVLKLTAVCLPLGGTPQAELLTKAPDGAWVRRAATTLDDGVVASFRVTGWDASRATPYRVVLAPGTPDEAGYEGTVPAEPEPGQTLVVASVNCTIHTARPLDRPSSGVPRLPGGRTLGLYTPENLYFPYERLVAGVRAAGPHLLVASGDQYYENMPTAPVDGPEPTLDSLYRFCLWLLSFRELTREVPCVVQVDDHDVYQPNLWGWDGREAPDGDFALGGYVRSPRWVNFLQRLQCGHDPDPYDPAPVEQGIGVYSTLFAYGGASFAVLEDRKSKNTTKTGKGADGEPLPGRRTLLGERQEAMLEAWATRDAGLPHIALTQTLWGCLQTRPDGSPLMDSDSGGSVPAGRDRALALVKKAGGIVVAGDQHLGSLVRHGVDGVDDGPVQLTAPAAGSLWQRWFQPAQPLGSPGATPWTGDWTDAYGNRMRVLAVANDPVTFAQFRAAYPKGGNELGDRSLKREGYVVVRVEPAARRYVLECWPWDADNPGTAAGQQFPGWPYVLPFDEV